MSEGVTVSHRSIFGWLCTSTPRKVLLMSKVRLLQDYLIPGSAENENTLIATYWLDFVSAMDEREQAPAVRFTESDLRDRVREFQKQMNAVVHDHESLRHALASEQFEPPVKHSATAGRPWKTPFPVATEEAEDDGNGYEPEDEKPSLPPGALGTLLLKILGK